MTRKHSVPLIDFQLDKLNKKKGLSGRRDYQVSRQLERKYKSIDLRVKKH